MKKLFTLVLAVMLVASMTTVSFAAESTTTLTTTVPAANYTLNIPANQEIPFGATSTDLGIIYVSDSAGFAEGKNLEVTITYTPFAADGVNTVIPYTFVLTSEARASEYYEGVEIASGEQIQFLGRENGTVGRLDNDTSSDVHAVIEVLSNDWGKALAGEYTSTITFTAEVVTE